MVRYIDDMRQIIQETSRVLTDGGQAVYVVGENTVHDTFIRNSLIVEDLANNAGLRCAARRSRELPANYRYNAPSIGACHSSQRADALRSGTHAGEDVVDPAPNPRQMHPRSAPDTWPDQHTRSINSSQTAQCHGTQRRAAEPSRILAARYWWWPVPDPARRMS